MREILFRGKGTSGFSNNKWVYGYYCKDFWSPQKGCGILPIDKECGGYVEVVPETICEFTGKLDKNKKKIFEGDIFQLEDDIFAVVIFSDGCFRLEEHGLCGTWTESGYDECGGGYGILDCEPIDWYSLFDMEVIGNIHDNPELIQR